MPKTLGASKLRKRRPLAEGNKTSARELEMFIMNDEPLYRQQWTPIIKHLVRRKKKGTYDSEKAIKLFEYLTKAGSTKYRKEYGGGPDMFTPAPRRLAAITLRNDLEGEYKLGNYDGPPFQ